MTFKLVAALLATTMAAPPQAPAPNAEADLAEAIELARQGELEGAIAALDRVVIRLGGAPGKQQELGQAYLWLAVSYLGLDQRDAAKARLMEGLRADPTMALDAKQFPPRVIGFFEDTRREFLAGREPPPPSPPAAPPVTQAPAPQPVAKKKGGKGLLIGVGVAVVAAGAAAVAGGGGGDGGGTANPPPTSAIANTTSTTPTASSTTTTTTPPTDGTIPPTSSTSTTSTTTTSTVPSTTPPTTPPTNPPTMPSTPPSSPPPTSPPCPTSLPTPAWITPGNGATVQGAVPLRCEPGVPAGCVQVIYNARREGADIQEVGRSEGAPYVVTWNTTNGAWPNGPYGVACFSQNDAGAASTGAVISVTVNNGLLQSDRHAADSPQTVAWKSELGPIGAKGQIVWDGVAASYVERNGEGTLELGPGPHRVEATLVDAAGEPGRWTFTFGGRFKRGSLRVVAGHVSRIGGDATEFRVQGKPGERLAFTFESQ